MDESRQCSAITAAGRGCSARAQGGQEWCFNHDPRRSEERRVNAHAGGRARARRQPSEIERIKKRIEEATNAVLRGRLDSGVVAVAFQGFNVLLRAMELERRLRDDVVFEERLKELEELARRSGW
jgi:hypothetical protein